MDMEVKTSSIGTAIQICPAQDCVATMARPDIDLKVKVSFLLNLKRPSIILRFSKVHSDVTRGFFLFKKIFIDVLFFLLVLSVFGLFSYSPAFSTFPSYLVIQILVVIPWLGLCSRPLLLKSLHSLRSLALD